MEYNDDITLLHIANIASHFRTASTEDGEESEDPKPRRNRAIRFADESEQK